MSLRALHMYMLRSLSHGTKKCDKHVYTLFFQPLIRRKHLGNWHNTYAKRRQKLANRTLAKQLVGETTVNEQETLWVNSTSKLGNIKRVKKANIHGSVAYSSKNNSLSPASSTAVCKLTTVTELAFSKNCVRATKSLVLSGISWTLSDISS